ncbi:MAG: serine protease [Sphingobacteriia bacterium]|nr:serine protease [Sphingobacteriia bacterium]NCC41018.1 serine protease [Gammaproteobacteria bacterium]
MIKLSSVSKPAPVPSAFESMVGLEEAAVRDITIGGTGHPGDGSRSLKFLAVKGKGEPIPVVPSHGGLESIIGPTDERIRILDTDLFPWRMICALRMRGASGAGAIGTGWLVGPKTVITAGHCVYSNHFFGGWASSLDVSAGRNGSDFPFGTVVSRRFSSVDLWVNSESPDFDIGCIHLDDPIGNEVGWFAVGTIAPDELEGYMVNISGYPGDRGRGTEQYHHSNRVLRVSERRLFYDVDTFGGQSGAPVWIHERDDAPPIAVGIHAYGVGGSPGGLEANSAPRIIPEVLEQIRAWVEEDGGWPGAT